MKYYDPKFMRNYIEEHKSEIDYVEAGMAEDWFWTVDTIYADGIYFIGLYKDTVEIAGITGSRWASPMMKVYYPDGTMREVLCYKEA